MWHYWVILLIYTTGGFISSLCSSFLNITVIQRMLVKVPKAVFVSNLMEWAHPVKSFYIYIYMSKSNKSSCRHVIKRKSKQSDTFTSHQHHSLASSKSSFKPSPSAGTCQANHWGVQSALKNLFPSTDQFSLWSAKLDEIKVFQNVLKAKLFPSLSPQSATLKA